MAQEKTSTKAGDDQPRDEDGRFTEKEDGQKSAGASSNASKSKDSDSKSASGGQSKSKDDASKASGS